MKIPAFWVLGNLYEVSQTVNQILDKYGRDNLITIDATSSTVEQIISELMNVDIFSNKRKVIRVKGLPENYTYLVNHLNYVNDKCVLIIECPKSIKIKNRESNVAVSALYKKIKENGKVCESPETAKLGESRQWAIGVAKQAFNKTLEADAAESLCELKNCVFDNIYSELGKISIYLGRRHKITIEDVQKCVYNDVSFNVWQFVDEVTVADYEGALKSVENLFSAVKYIVSDMEMALNALIYRMEMVLFSRELGKYVTFEKIKAHIGMFHKKNKDSDPQDKYSDGLLRMFCFSEPVKKALNKWNRPRIAEILSSLYFAQNSIRYNNGNKNRCKLIFVALIQDICDINKNIRKNLGVNSKLMMME